MDANFVHSHSIEHSSQPLSQPRLNSDQYKFKVIAMLLEYSFMHLSMLGPMGGGGGPWAYVGHLTSIATPTFGNLTKNLGPRVVTFAFFARRNGTKAHRLMSLPVHWPIEVARH